jgi:hypothetical protein
LCTASTVDASSSPRFCMTARGVQTAISSVLQPKTNWRPGVTSAIYSSSDVATGKCTVKPRESQMQVTAHQVSSVQEVTGYDTVM